MGDLGGPGPKPKPIRNSRSKTSLFTKPKNSKNSKNQKISKTKKPKISKIGMRRNRSYPQGHDFKTLLPLLRRGGERLI
jgi:hypothetical protein